MRRLGLVVLFAGGLALAACGGSGSSGSGGGYGSSAPSGSKASTSSRPAAPAASGATVSVRSTSLGDVLTDAQGMTLYLYQPDGTSTKSKVPTGLRAAWPPVVADGVPKGGSGIDQSRLVVATQPDGARWVAYGGHLLYSFTGDAAAGETNGQGLGGVWFAVAPSGEAITS